MKKTAKRLVPVLALLLAVAMIASACGDDDAEVITTTGAVTTTGGGDTTTTGGVETTTTAGTTEPIQVGELAYYTGAFGPYGATLTAEANFPFLEAVNVDPPLGRTIEMLHEDIGTVGEGQAARKLLEQDGVEVLLSPAHEYLGYRDYILEYEEAHDLPMMPTVHGGVIPGNIGGVPEEPIFRAQGLDEGQGVMDVVYAEQIGVQTIVILTTPTAGYQMSANAAERACEMLGIEVLARIDAPGESATYRTEIEQLIALDPDAVLVQAQAVESGTMLRQAFEAGASFLWLGELGWTETEFVGTATAEAIAGQVGVFWPNYGLDTTTPAYEFYCPLWEGNPEYMQYTPDLGCDDPYSHTTYDLGIVTALAIELGGAPNSSVWAPAVHSVANAPGTVCYTYADCLALIRAGEEIDYYGVSGPWTYSPGGVNAVLAMMMPVLADGTTGEGILIDPDHYLEVLDASSSDYEG